jgi:glycosyltransferase involved in cell wall biosynthesis
LKILFVIDSLGSGGAQRLFVNIVNGLSTLHDVSVLLYNANSNFFRDDLLPNIPVHYIERGTKNGFKFEVIRMLKRHMGSADVVVSFLPTANIYCAVAGIMSRRARHIACEMSVVNETESTVRRMAANFANFLSRHVICNSFAQADYIRGRPGMSGKVSAIWNGCADLPFAARTLRDPRSLSMIVVGRVAYPKNGIRLLQALHLFYERNGFVHRVSWAGRDDSDERARLMKKQMLEFLEQHPMVAEKFRFVGEVSDIGVLYAAADTLILPSIYEGVPNVICEAMLSGCIVVATRISDNETILGANEERGFLCDPLSPEDICLAIERRSSMSVKDINQMTQDARRFAEEHFLVPKMIDGYRQVIDDVIQ